MAKQMTSAEITKCVLMRCRGASYREIAVQLERALYTVKRALDPQFRKEHNAVGQKWRKENPEKAEAATKAWRESIPDYGAKAYHQNRKNRIASVAKHYQKNKRRILNSQNEQHKQRRKIDPQFRIAMDIRIWLNKAYKRQQHRIPDIGCTGPQLRLWLVMHFQPGMGHHNHGEWQFDHIRPLSSFDLTIQSEFLKACHYTNIQPLWVIDHQKKSASELT